MQQASSFSINQEETNSLIMKNNQIESERFQYKLNDVDTRKKNFKIKSSAENDSKKKKKKKVKYPTQMLMIGNIRCFFIKYFKNGRSPLFSIGPSWPFTIGLLTFAFVAFFYFLWMISLLKIIDTKFRLVAVALLITNILALLTGILQNPGIPQQIIDRILKEQLGKGTENKEEDIEAGQDMPQ